jgi:hypothetical protein
MIPKVGPFMVTGDFNICLAKKPDHEVFQTLRTMGFSPLTSEEMRNKKITSEATHLDGGHIDQVWLRGGTWSGKWSSTVPTTPVETMMLY